jgi:hypothetical protein
MKRKKNWEVKRLNNKHNKKKKKKKYKGNRRMINDRMNRIYRIEKSND